MSADLDSIIDGGQPTQVAAVTQPLAPANPLDAEIDGSAQHDLNQQKFGGIGEQAIAGLEGVARGATLGGSDWIEKHLGVNPEDIKARREANPVTSFAGNTIGTAGLIGLTGGAAAPIEVAAAGVGKLGAAALGYAAEGAVLGAGNAISDYSLGDPNLNAQKVLSDVGMGALLGGALGVGGKALEGAGILGKKVASVAEEANSKAQTSEALSGTASSPESFAVSGAGAADEQAPLLKGLNSQKDKASDIVKAGQAIGAPVTEGMTSSNKWVQQADDALVNGAPTFSGIRRQKLYEQGYKAVNDTLDSVLDTGEQYGGGPMTAKQLGESLQGSITSKIASESEPIEAMYEALKPHMSAIDLAPSETSSLANELLAMPEAKTSFGQASTIKNVAKDVMNLDTVEDLRNYRSQLNQSFSSTASPGEKHVVGMLSDKLTELEEGSIMKAASNPDLPPETQDLMKSLIDQKNAANEAYKPFREGLNTLVEQLGKKNAGGTQTAINFIKDLDPESLSSKLFDKKFSSFNDFFSEKFPEEAALMKQYQKQQLKTAASKSGEFSPKVFFNKVNSLEPEIKSAIFAPDELQKIKDAETYTRALPKSFNPSGTSHVSAFREFFQSPTGAGIANARDFGIEAFIKTMGALPESIRGNPFEIGAKAADKFNKLSAIKKISDNVDNLIQSNSKSIFGLKDAARGAALGAGAKESDEGYDAIVGNVKNLAQNPSGIIDHMAAHTEGLHDALPNVSQSMQSTMMAGLQFLNSKLPGQNAQQLPYSKEYEPSALDKQKFMQYYAAVNDPVSVMNNIKDGTLTNHSMEALEAVHPQLLKQMQTQVAGDLKGNENKQMPYSKRMALAKFLNAPLDSSMLPSVINANQMALSSPHQGQQAAQKQGRGGAHSLSKLNVAARAGTETQRLESDES